MKALLDLDRSIITCTTCLEYYPRQRLLEQDYQRSRLSDTQIRPTTVFGAVPSVGFNPMKPFIAPP